MKGKAAFERIREENAQTDNYRGVVNKCVTRKLNYNVTPDI